MPLGCTRCGLGMVNQQDHFRCDKIIRRNITPENYRKLTVWPWKMLVGSNESSFWNGPFRLGDSFIFGRRSFTMRIWTIHRLTTLLVSHRSEQKCTTPLTFFPPTTHLFSTRAGRNTFPSNHFFPTFVSFPQSVAVTPQHVPPFQLRRAL